MSRFSELNVWFYDRYLPELSKNNKKLQYMGEMCLQTYLSCIKLHGWQTETNNFSNYIIRCRRPQIIYFREEQNINFLNSINFLHTMKRRNQKREEWFSKLKLFQNITHRKDSNNTLYTFRMIQQNLLNIVVNNTTPPSSHQW